ncbi:transposase [Nocardia sp. NBC_01730]|nr:transposase [Nocardia sp. NBC_01730]
MKGLARTRLAKSVHDAGWGMFIRMLEAKACRYGRVFGEVDRFFPSSQRCSACGRIDGPKPLNIREWFCPCGAAHERDLNAARNILAARRTDSPTPVELTSDSTSVEQSASNQEPTGSAA